ncbi:MAG TPA: 4-hydroxythreonine-4-phosphate dehydrogenase PdxA [Bacteroidales bacterium]|nr:4-hydroxythreonine-4-phosphate dehydrogenase PdxA [Bacteroidales bacterium]
MDTIIRIGITHGDMNGIGYEVIMKAFADSRMLDGKQITVYGSSKAAAFHKKQLDVPPFNLINSITEAHPKRINVINCVNEDVRVELGVTTKDSGKAAFDALQCAVRDLKDGNIDVIVTAPINKQAITEAGFTFPGHTEFFASEFETDSYLMVLISDLMRVGVVAAHVPIAEVASYITKDKIVQKLEVLNTSLFVDLGIRKPRIAVLGLNPHAGDNGIIGNEEQEIIKPALLEARDKGIMALGPYSADGFFGAAEYKNFDAILGMYHDQILAPFKALDFDSAVNFTAGLPIVRVSPGHGTAYDIVGQNVASENSFIKAIYMACDVFKKRSQNETLLTNQLK